MKTSIYIIALFLSMSFSSLNETRVYVSDKSEIIIKGESNVNSFQCVYNQDLIASELTVTHYQKKDKTILEGAIFLIQSKGFDCGHRMITNDLKSVLKADDYNSIRINVIELRTKENKIVAVSKIKIAGIEKTYEIPIEINSETNNVKGNLALNIKDFNLKSPKKLMGLIKIEDTVNIAFNLYLEF